MAADLGIYKEYRTKDGDRWDLLAWEWYGDPLRWEPILAANPHAPIFPRLPRGIRLLIPVLPYASNVRSIESIPPWLR